MTIQSNFPSLGPSLMLDFANSKNLDPRITFTRSSTASFYDGKTTAKADENLLQYASQFDNGVWGKVNTSVTANSATAPDGTATADSIVENSTASGYYYAVQYIYKSATALTYTFSVFVKPSARKWVMLTVYDGTSTGNRFWFNLEHGTTGTSTTIGGGFTSTSYSIVPAANGFYRVVCTCTTNTATTLQCFIHPAISNGVETITGVTSQVACYVWGAQLEQQSRATKYTVTTSQSVANYTPALSTSNPNVARFTSDPTTGESLGLLVEEGTTNIMVASSQFETWSKSYITPAANATVAPDGTLTATKIIETVDNNQHSIQLNITISNTTAYTHSVYLKAAERTKVGFYAYNGTGFIGVDVDLTTGVITAATAGGVASGLAGSTITPVGNGWYRVSTTYTSTGTTHQTQVRLLNASSAASYIGDNNSGAYMWGVQLEAKAFPTSYVSTPITYTSRASTATYLSTDGTIRTAAANVARYEPNVCGGTNLLAENAVSNSLTYSSDFGASLATSGLGYAIGPNLGGFFTVAPFASQAPDGTMSAVRFISTSTTQQGLFLRATTSLPAGTYTASIWMYVPTQSGVTNWSILVDAQDSAVDFASSAYITTFDAWVRVPITITYTATRTFLDFNIRLNSNTATPSTAGFTLYAWGAQIETYVMTSYIPSVETHTGRSSTATYYNSAGVLSTAASGAARTTYNPGNLTAAPKLLVEAAATNLMLYSEQLDNAAWTKTNTTITVNAIVSPDGATTADKVVENSTATVQHLLSLSGVAVTNGTAYAFSVYAKNAGWSSFFLQLGAGGAAAEFNFNTGVATTSLGATFASMVYVGNGWYRCSVMGVANASQNMYIYKTAAPYTGDGTSGVYLWGFQLEAGYGATSYIPTTSAAVTRAADTVSTVAGTRAADVYSAPTVTRAADVVAITGSNFSSWYRQDQGSLFCSWTIPDTTSNTDSNHQVVRLLSSLANPTISARMGYSSYRGLRYYAQDGGGTFEYTIEGVANTGTSGVFAMAWSGTNDFAVSENGATALVDSTGSITDFTAVDGLQIGGSNGGMNGTIRKLAYYPTRITNAQLQAITG